MRAHACGEHFINELRNGSWVDASRIRNYSAIIIVFTFLGLLWLVTAANGLVMADGQPVGADFSGIYSTGVLTTEGNAAAAYDWGALRILQQQIFPSANAFYAWSYPPPFFFVANLLALAPYAIALILWQVTSLALYLISQRSILRPVTSKWLLPSLGFTAVFINLFNGHNGLLSAFLFGLGLALLRTRPLMAGLLLGALCYKPQFGLLIPLVLLVARQGKAFLGAAICVLLLCAAATLAYGDAIWPAFLASLEPTRTILLEQGDTGWYKIQSLFSAIRSVGGSVTLAYALHGALAIAVAAITARAWHRLGAHPTSYALLIIGSLLITPYILDYDLTILAPALAFLTLHGLKTGFAPYQRTLLACVWVMPFVARIIMQNTGIPLGFAALLLLFAHTAYWSRAASAQLK